MKFCSILLPLILSTSAADGQRGRRRQQQDVTFGDGKESSLFTPQTSFLDTLRLFDQLRASATTVTRNQDSNLDHFSAGNQDDIVLCHFSTLLPFTEGDKVPRLNNIEDAVAAALAAQHLNNGDGSVLPAVSGLSKRCPIRFTIEYSDTEFQGGVTLAHVAEQTSREMPDGRLPCAFVGAYRSAVSQPTSIATGLMGYPQVSAASTSPDLDDKSLYPLFGRTVPSDAGGALPLIMFLRNQLQVQHLAVINANDAYGNAYVESMRTVAKEHAPDLVIHQIPVDLEETSIPAAIASLKDSGYRFVFCIVFGLDFHDTLLTEAVRQDVAGNGVHTWLFGDSFGGVLDGRTFPADSPLHAGYQGIGMFEASGGLPGLPVYDKFSKAMAQLFNADDLEYLRQMFPKHDGFPQYDLDFLQVDSGSAFLNPIKSSFSPMTYEAVIALGLAACDAYELIGPDFTGPDHYAQFKNTTFEGISGTVVMDPESGTRDPTSALFKITNFVAQEVQGDVQFRGFVSGLFQDAEWNELVPYIFNDGTTNLPQDLPPPETEGELSLGLILGAAGGIAAILGVIVFLFYENKRKQNDAIWKIKKEDIIFGDTPVVVGQGTFGEVLLGEYRGTQVVVKRVKDRKRSGGSSTGKESGIGFSKYDSGQEAESAPPNTKGENSRYGFGSVVGTKSTNIALMSGTRSGVMGRTKADAKRRGEFLEEMRSLSRLRHPCITTIMGAVTGKDPMIVLEYMEHGSLYDILHNETMPIDGELLLPILRDIAQGVRFLHASVPQVIHGDLKSANILIDSKFRAKVADFGLSSKKNKGGTGTPFWMAPELLRAESGNTPATDVFSFGIILYEVYSRRDPYDGENPKEVLRLVADKEVRKRPPAPRNMCDKVKSLMDDCLEEEPDKRPTFEELDLRVKRIDAESAVAGTQSNTKSAVSLFDIFPRHIAEALRDGRSVEPEHRECVTIFFSDIVGFTDISSELDPRKIANLLDRLYSKFDALSSKHDIFKLETIGDAYVAVSNLIQDQDVDHTKRIAEFAMEAVVAANETPIDLDDSSKGTVSIRVGFHSGPIVADVVGTRNPRYCLFGDTINTASRMESNSEVNRIHCSREAAKLMHRQCPSIPLQSRGRIAIKGKGRMHTYWVNEGKVTASGVFRGSSTLSMMGDDLSGSVELIDENALIDIEEGL